MSSFRFQPADFLGVRIENGNGTRHPSEPELAQMSDDANKKLVLMEKECEVVHGVPGKGGSFGWTRRQAYTDTHRSFIWRPEPLR
jgi:hypothetical protein